MSSAVDVRICHVSPDHCIATCSDTIIIIWRGEPTPPAIGVTEREIIALAATRPRGIAMLIVVEADTPMPNAAARARFGKGLQIITEHVRATAIVHEGTGFAAATLRAVVTGLGLLAGKPFEHRLFGRADEACRWLAQSFAANTRGTLDSIAVLSALAGARRALNEHTRRPGVMTGRP